MESRRAVRTYRKAYADVGTEPSDELEKVLLAWDEVHETIREAAKNGGADIVEKLDLNLRHLKRHVEPINDLLNET